MKYFLILFLFIFNSNIYAQNVHFVSRTKYDSLQQEYINLKVKDSLIIKDKNFKLNRINFYLNLCIKNPSQDKYLKGWIKRALK